MQFHKRFGRAASVTFFGLSTMAHLTALPVRADVIEPPALTCTTPNCEALTLTGRVNSHTAGFVNLANVWVAQFSGRTGRCLRFEVTEETQNFAMSVVAPDGDVYLNKNVNTGPCPQCPRVIVRSTTTGVYTVVIGGQAAAGVDRKFTLKVGAYANSNPNCTPGSAAH